MNFLLIAAYRAGYQMYGPESGHVYFSFYSTDIVHTTLSERIEEDEENGYDPEDFGLLGTHEYGFTLDGVGIDCADTLISEHATHDTFYTYHPEVGVSVITGCNATLRCGSKE